MTDWTSPAQAVERQMLQGGDPCVALPNPHLLIFVDPEIGQQDAAEADRDHQERERDQQHDGDEGPERSPHGVSSAVTALQ